MLLIIFSIAYTVIGVLLAAALITSKNVVTNKKEALACIAISIIWPIAMVIASGFGLFDNIQQNLYAKRLVRHQQIVEFSRNLFKMGVISRNTLTAIIHKGVK